MQVRLLSKKMTVVPSGDVDGGPPVYRELHRHGDEKFYHRGGREEARDQAGEGRRHARGRPAAHEKK